MSNFLALNSHYSFFKQLFSPKVNWFENGCVLVDSGFQGFGKDYQTKKLFLPQKRKKIAI